MSNNFYVGIIRAFLLAGLMSALSCGSSGVAHLYLRLTGTALDTDAVVITFSVNGVLDKRSPFTFQKNTSYFGVDYPDPGATASTNVAVETYSASCLTGAGQGQFTISGGQITEGEIAVVAKGRACPLTITRVGEGNVQSDKGEITCGQTCTAKFQVGTTVTLTATPSLAGTRFQWAGKCSGTASTCPVSIDGPAAVTIDFRPRICTPVGFCWEYPWPLGANLAAAWVAPDSTLYAVGGYGTFIYGDGIKWSTVNAGNSDLNGVWGSSRSDVWAVGGVTGSQSTIIHYDGQSVTTAASPVPQKNLRAIWGAGPTTIWAVGEGGNILRYDGTSWKVNTTLSEDLYAVWGSSANDIWVAGANDMLAHSTGGGWMVQSSGLFVLRSKPAYYSIWGTGPGDIWAVGDRVARWNGTTWTAAEGGMPAAGNCRSIWGTGANTVWCGAAGRFYRWDGLQWSVAKELSSESLPSSIAGSGTNAWSVGPSGFIASLTQDTWHAVSDPSLGTFNAAVFVAGAAGAVEGWAVGRGGTAARTKDGLAWTAESLNTTSDLNAIWASGPDNIWAVGLGTCLRFNNKTWTAVPIPTGTDITNVSLTSIFGSGPNDIWIVGNTPGASSLALHWDGSSLNPVPKPPDGVSSVVVYQGVPHITDGNGLGIYKLSGGVWNLVKSGKIAQLAVQGNVLFAVGGDGISRFDGTAWNADVTGEGFSALYAKSPTEAWAWGGSYPNARLMRFNGTTWSEVDRFPQPINGIGGFGGDTWVVGGGGSILHLKQ